MAESNAALFCCIVILLFFHISIVVFAATDTINITQSIRDAEKETLVSKGEIFELVFFSPGSGNSRNRYLGIRYKNTPTERPVWVANRKEPLTDSSGVLQLTALGAIVIINSTATVWASNWSKTATSPSTTVARLLDTGNLVIKDEKDTTENYLWQSFDYPCDTFLPHMKIGKNLRTGLDLNLSSWMSNDDPSPGNYTYGLDTHGYPQKVLWKGSTELYRSGPWNGIQFSGSTPLIGGNNNYINYTFVFNSEEVYYAFEVLNPAVIRRAVLNPTATGSVQIQEWSDTSKSWTLVVSAPYDICDSYAQCGKYGRCEGTACSCLEGFKPRNQKEWASGTWSSGCVRSTELNCLNHGDGFLNISGIKVPDTKNSRFDRTMKLSECREKCFKDCNCTAYSSLDIRRQGGSGCLLWFGDLLDVRVIRKNEQPVYVRMALTDIGRNIGSHRNNEVKMAAWYGSISVILLLGLALGFFFFLWRRKQSNRQGILRDTFDNPKEALEVHFFDYATMSNSTNNFSMDNKLGEGGFGPVYKGKLGEGLDVAVKILSDDSRQGVDEFKNEVLFIAKLQHRNLVRLLGCCIERRKMLVYEYMPNKSLDYFIFDEEKSVLLDWPKRLHIINGISRGLLYLHQDSRLRIIHRDLKVGNILLDYEMNPKISDFGLARSFLGNQTEESTTRVVGTHGYMSPEYAIDGLFSIKSDVFSFGVLVLEIVSGKKNRGFNHPEHHLNLLGHAWRLFKENRTSELVDHTLWETCSNPCEVLRSIHVGLLCVQEFPEHRPSMPSVILMLGSENSLPEPNEPGFYMKRNVRAADPSSSEAQSSSTNEVSMTLLEAR